MGDIDTDADAEYAEMPKFAVTHEGWLHVKIGKLNRHTHAYASCNVYMHVYVCSCACMLHTSLRARIPCPGFKIAVVLGGGVRFVLWAIVSRPMNCAGRRNSIFL